MRGKHSLLRGAFTMGALSWLAACAGATARTEPRTGQGDEVVRTDAALLAMFDTRGRDTLLIDRALASTDVAQRARAALLVGQNAVRARYATLQRLLVSPDTAVAANAAYALGLAHDTSAIFALGRAFAGAPDAVAREAAWSLGEIGEPARTVITIALGDGSAASRTSSTAALRSAAVRAEMVMAAVKLRPLPAAAVIGWSGDRSDEVVRAVAYDIARGQLAAGVRVMLGLAESKDEVIRQHVARALGRPLAGDSLGSRAREVLARLIVDPSPRVRANAARSIGTFGTTARADYDRAARDADANVRVAASENAHLVYAREAEAWRTAWTRDTTYMVRRTLMGAARRAGSDALASGEDEWAKSTDWRLRVAALDARAAGAIEERGALARAAASDVDARVRSAALAIQAAPDDTTLRALARAALRDPDAGVRASAIGAMARYANAAEVGSVLDVLASASANERSDIEEAALRYVASAWNRDSARLSPAVRLRITELPMPAEAVTRALAAGVTPLARWKAADVAARPMADYERIARRWLAPGARMPSAVLHTERGDITLDLLGADAPLVVDAFVSLANRGFYRNTRFHRVVPNFVAQDGDPRGDGGGGPGFGLRDAYTRNRHERGCLGLATSGPDTGGSQYYLCHAPQPHLDGHYTVFGRIRSGFDVLDAIVQGDRVIGVDIR